MKHLRILMVLLAVLATASIVYAQRKSSTTSQAGSEAAIGETGSSWVCPMWGSAPGGQSGMRSSAPYDRSMMDGRPEQHRTMGPRSRWSNSGQYGPMGPGMMNYDPAQSNQGRRDPSAPQNHVEYGGGGM